MPGHPFRNLSIATLGLIHAGCLEPGLSLSPATTVEQETTSPEVVRSMLSTADASPTESGLRIQLQFDVVRVDLPVTEARASGKVWNHVDEMRIPAPLAASLVKNGLRMGIAGDDSWPALSTLFAENGAAVNRTQAVVEPGLPLWLSLGPFTTSESVFVFPEDRGMTGYTFEGGTKCFRIDYETLPTDPPEINLRVSPEVHMEEGPPRWVSTGREYQLMRSAEHHTFQGLVTDWTLREGEFLVIGPDAGSNLSQRLGTRFLAGAEDGAVTDVMICVKPRLFRMEGKAP